jgi:hypothetical protein
MSSEAPQPGAEPLGGTVSQQSSPRKGGQTRAAAQAWDCRLDADVSSLAFLYRVQGRHGEAEPLFREASGGDSEPV